MDFPSGRLGRGDGIPPAQLVPDVGRGALDPFRILLHSISVRLSEKELSEMKFLCQDKFRKRPLFEAKSGTDFFNILIQQQKITRFNLELLKTLLQHVERLDLLSEVVQFEEGQPDPDDQPDEHENRLLDTAVAVMCEHVGRDWKRLMRELRMSEVKLDRIEEAYPRKLYEQLVQALREWRKWKGKDAKAADLIRALRGCNLNLVADRVEERILQLDAGTR